MNAKQPIAAEADWEQAPSLLEASDEIELALDDCELEYWLKNVAQGSIVGTVHGRRADAVIPPMLREPGPLRDSRIEEAAFRALSEDAATRICALIAAAAPNVAGMEFFTTQALDEARHANSMRHHLLDLGVPAGELFETIERVAGPDRDRIIEPLWDWALPEVEDHAGDLLSLREAGHVERVYINGVVVITILLEGVLAPTTELAERKWKPISEASADVERGACVDEIRHLAVGSWIVREHVRTHDADEKERILALLEEGRAKWESVPVVDMLMTRERRFQEGIEEHRSAIGDGEIWPGRRLVDTTVEERVMKAATWSVEVQEQRMRYMGLG
ncbi:MAG: VlmB-like protein [Actinobacteria bacterium]|nr:VlmB-like protein [Actinomycetota bacterium]